MSKTIAVFGAGPGMGRSVARRFGCEGFQVALVARNQARLAAFSAELAGDGIEAVLTLPSREVILWCRRCETAIFKVEGESSAGQGLLLLAVYEDEPT